MKNHGGVRLIGFQQRIVSLLVMEWNENTYAPRPVSVCVWICADSCLRSSERLKTKWTDDTPQLASFDSTVCYIPYTEEDDTYGTWTGPGKDFKPKESKVTQWSPGDRTKLLTALRRLHTGESAVPHVQNLWYYLSAHVMKGTKSPADCEKQVDRILQRHTDWDPGLLGLL